MDSPFSNFLEQYVFKVAETFIEQASPDQQQYVLNLLRDIGKHTDQQEPGEVAYWDESTQDDYFNK